MQKANRIVHIRLHSGTELWGDILLLFGIYAALGILGLSITPVNRFASFVWPPTGIAMAALLLYGYRLWPGIFVGAFFVNVFTGAPPLVALGIAVGNTLESVIAVYLLRHFGKFRNVFERVREVFSFVTLGAIASTLVSALIGVWSLWMGNLITRDAFATTLQAWWIGDMLSALIITPLILVWRNPRPFFIRSFQKNIVEIIALAILLVGICVAVFGGFFSERPSTAPFSYLLFIPVVWAALRFGGRGAITATSILSLFAIWGTARGLGPFAREIEQEGFLLLQLFMGVATVTNLTLASTVIERRRAEEELERRLKELAIAKADVEQEEIKYEALVENLGDGIVMTEPGGKVLFVNKAFEDLMGFTGSELVGKYPSDTFPVLDERGIPIPRGDRPLIKAVETKGKVTVRMFLAEKNGTMFPVIITATPIILEGETLGAIEIIRDISKEQEIDLAKTEFVALASHQLRTPLTTISWFAEALLKGTRGEVAPQRKRYINKIYEADKRMIRLVNDLLNVSRIELGTLAVESKETHLPQIIHSLLAEFAKQLKLKHLQVKKEYDSDIPKLSTDPKLVRIILHNLIPNAIKYTPDRGAITVGIDTAEDAYIITVADTGLGIPKSAQKQLFKKFFRGDNVKEVDGDGTGLGLYIAKSILERMGGHITFTSRLHRGTKFHVTLPRTTRRKKGG